MGDVWIFDAVGGGATRLTSDPLNESRPLWSPDGQDVMYVKGKSIYRRPISGTGEETLVYGGPEAVQPVDWSADGRFLLYSREFADLWVLDLESGETSPWLATSFREGPARFSPEGRWVAYCSDETGRFEVYVEDFPERREKHPVSLGEGRGPVWSRDGQELFFYRPGRGLMAVRVDLGSEFGAEKPRFLFDVEIRVIEGYAFYDVTPDGQRFLVNHLVGQTTNKPLVFRTRWTEALEE